MMSDGRTEPLDGLISPLGQLSIIAGIAVVLALAANATTAPVSTVLVTFSFIMSLLGICRIVTAPSPPERFEVGSSRADHEYRDVTITAIAEIWYGGPGPEPGSEGTNKLRTVEVAALTEDGTEIIRESDTETVGSKPFLFGLGGGDLDSARSTADHILAVATPVHEYLDEWLMADSGDPVAKAALETEFVNIESEMSRER